MPRCEDGRTSPAGRGTAAAIVFYSTQTIAREIERHGLVRPQRLVQAPYGVSPEFDTIPREDDGAREALGAVAGHAFALHVGSSLPRKRLDVLFRLFARLRAKRPNLRLVQQGADFTEAQRTQIAQLGITDAVFQPTSRDFERRTLAGLYRRAAVVLVTSEAEGFGFPVIEALACGAVVVASDIPVLREVGADEVVYAPMRDDDAWVELVDSLLAGVVAAPPLERRLAQAARYTWHNHARTVLDAYKNLAVRSAEV